MLEPSDYVFHLGVQPGGEDLYADFSQLTNFSMALFGASGTGKSFSIKSIISSLAQLGVTFIVIDTQGDLGPDDGGYHGLSPDHFACERFNYLNGTVSLNPLEICTDEDGGGLMPAIERAIRAVTYFHPSMGIRQKAFLKDLLIDCYERAGITLDDAHSWTRVPPTIDDLIEVLEDYRKAAASGLDLSIFKKVGRLRKKALSAKRKTDMAYEKASAEQTRSAEIRAEMTEEELGQVIQDLQDEVARMVEAEVMSGGGMSDRAEYDFNTITGVKFVLEGMAGGKIYSGRPAWQIVPGKINVINVKGMPDNQQQALFFLLLGRIFSDEMRTCPELNMGIPRTITVFDEAKIFAAVCEDSMSPFPRIVTEGRKAGMGAIIGAQSPAQVSKEILSNIALNMVLPIHRNEWQAAKRQFGLSEDMMERMKPRSDAFVSINQEIPRLCHLWQLDPPPHSERLKDVANL